MEKEKKISFCLNKTKYIILKIEREEEINETIKVGKVQNR